MAYYFFRIIVQDMEPGKAMLIGSVAAIIMTLAGVEGKAEPIKWNRPIIITMVSFGIGMFFIGLLHTVGDGFVLFPIDLIIILPLFYYVWINRGDHETFYLMICSSILLLGIISFIYCFYLSARGDLIIIDGRVAGYTRHFNFLGSIGAVLFMASIFLLAVLFRRIDCVAVCSLGLGIGITYVALSESRTALLSEMASLVVMVCFVAKNRNSIKMSGRDVGIRLGIILAAVVIVTFAGMKMDDVNYKALNSADINPVEVTLIMPAVYAGDELPAEESGAGDSTIIDRFDTSGDLNSFSSGRLAIWKIYAENLSWLGRPKSEIRDQLREAGSIRAHNNFLEYFYRCGYIVGAIYVLFYIAVGTEAFRRLIGRKHKDPVNMMLVMVVFTYMIYSLIEIAYLPFTRIVPCVFFLMIAPLMGEKKNPEISVIIPFHNVEKYLGDCIDSVLAQKGVLTEIILVNDGSTDGSEAIAKAYADKHENILLHSIEHSGPGHARNIAMEMARGKYIVFADADDLIVPGIYQRMLRAAEENSADICICNIARFDSEKRWGSDLQEKVYKEYSVITDIRDNTGLIYDTCSVNKLIRRDHINDIKLRFPEDVVYEDISFNIGLHLKSSRVVMLAETGYLWRVRDDKDNPSISQLHKSDRNVRDRFTASQWIADNVIHCDVPERLKHEAIYRLLVTDLKIILDSVRQSSEEQAAETFAGVQEFIDKHIDPEVMETLPVIDLQRYRLVQEGDVEGYKRLLDYREEHYSKAPVEERDGMLYADLPDELFTVEKRTLNDEFARLIRKTWIDEVRQEADGIEFDAHIYIRRYNMSHPGDQQLKVFLVNEETNQKIEIDHREKKTEFLTENFGTVEDDYQGKVSHYNYDYTGFTFKVDKSLGAYVKTGQRLKFSVIVDYNDRMFSGTQIIKGINGQNRQKARSCVIKGHKAAIQPAFGAQRELQITVDKKLFARAYKKVAGRIGKGK